MSVPVVGLTGGIASGKSTVARTFGQLGVPVIDADQLAREVVAPGTDGLAEIVSTFGSEVLLPDGSLNRKALGARVFQDKALLGKLNAITHPRIAMLAGERMQRLAATGVPYLMYEAALIVENGMYRGMRGLVVVSVNAETQLERLMFRDGLSEAEARARIASQAPLEHKLKVADFVIDNSGPEDALSARVQDVHALLLAHVKANRP